MKYRVIMFALLICFSAVLFTAQPAAACYSRCNYGTGLCEYFSWPVYQECQQGQFTCNDVPSEGCVARAETDEKAAEVAVFAESLNLPEPVPLACTSQ